MTWNCENEKTYCLDDAQRTDAHMALKRGWPVDYVACQFGMTDEQLYVELGLPQWKSVSTNLVASRFDVNRGDV